MNLRPFWMRGAPQVGANPIGRLTRKVWNRTGGATVSGAFYMFDLGLTAAVESVVNSQGNLLPAVANHKENDPASGWKNIVLPTTAMLRSGVFCQAMSAVADNEELEVLIIGETTAPAGQTGTDATFAPWSRFEPANGVATLAVITTSTASTSRMVFYNTASVVVSSSVTTTAVAGWFNGYGF